MAAVSAILTIRFFLKITGYPQVGGNGLHIAHMLWGGMLLVLALILLMVFIDREVKNFAVVVGGFGFGIFIDEVGKFITADNNYFYQPAVAIIYVFFVILFLVYRYLERSQRLTKKEYLINALEFAKDVVSHDFDKEEKRRVLSFLQKSDSNNPITQTLKETIATIEAVNPEKPNLLSQAKEEVADFYENLVKKIWFRRTLISFFIVVSVVFLVRALIFLGASPTLAEEAQFFFTIISGLLVVLGVYYFQKSNLEAYQMFKRSVLVSILLTQPFLFYTDQFLALLGLGFNLLILFSLQFLIEHESVSERVNKT